MNFRNFRQYLPLVLIAASSIAWGSNIRQPLINASPACDQEVIAMLHPLTANEKDYVGSYATSSLLSLRQAMVGFKNIRIKYSGKFGYEEILRKNDRDENSASIKLQRCDELVSKFVTGDTATKVVTSTAGNLDIELLERFIRAGASLNRVTHYKIEKYSSFVWRNLVMGAIDTKLSFHTLVITPEQAEALASDLQPKYLSVVLRSVKNINDVGIDGNTILHTLAERNSDSADAAIKQLVEAGANTRTRNKQGKLPLDIYVGKSKEVLALLSGAAPIRKPLEITSQQDVTQLPSSNLNNQPATQLVAGDFSGHITSTLNKGERINGTLRLKESGDFEYQGTNGVNLVGRFRLVDGNRITGTGTSYLPTLFGIRLVS